MSRRFERRYADMKQYKDAQFIYDCLEAQFKPEQITVSSDANGTQPVWNEKREIVGFTAARLSLLEFLRILVKEEGMSLPEAMRIFLSWATTSRFWM